MRMHLNHHTDTLGVVIAYVCAVALSSVNEALGAISLSLSIAFTSYKFYQSIKNYKKEKDHGTN